MNKTLIDISECPKCGSDNTYRYDIDELEFDDFSDKGHVKFKYCCEECRNHFEVSFNFIYEIVK